jgi:hypothetical protein
MLHPGHYGPDTTSFKVIFEFAVQTVVVMDTSRLRPFAIALVLLGSHESSYEHEYQAGTLRLRDTYSVARTGFHLLKLESNHENSMLLWGFEL